MTSFSPTLEQTLHRSLAIANERNHEYATLEHLLLGLSDDNDARKALGANLNLAELIISLRQYIAEELESLVSDGREDAKPTAGFNRVIQRAVVRVQSAKEEEVTGTDVLIALFSEKESHATYFLKQQNCKRQDIVQWQKNGTVKPSFLYEVQKTGKRFPAPIDDVVEPYSYGWSSGKITVVAGPLNVPTLPFANSAKDLKQWLASTRKQVDRLNEELRSGRFNVRTSYSQTLLRYSEDIPWTEGEGNFLSADGEARILQSMFAADASSIPAPVAARLKSVLEHHYALRAFFPEVSRFYDAVRQGHLTQPLPQDSVTAFASIIEENTPDIFDPSIRYGLVGDHERYYVVEDAREPAPTEDVDVTPPIDPFGEISASKGQAFSIAAIINALVKAFLAGKDVLDAGKAWEQIAVVLLTQAQPVIEWLRSFLSNSA